MLKDLFDLQLFADEGEDNSNPDDGGSNEQNQEGEEPVSFAELDSNEQIEAIKKMREQEEKEDDSVSNGEGEGEKEEEEVEDEEQGEESESKKQDLPDSFENIDPNKLPPELKAIYKNMEKLMQQKSQKQSEQMRLLENLIAREQQAQQQKESSQKQPLEEAKNLIDSFRQEFQMYTGEEYNEYDPAHQKIWFDYNTARNQHLQAQQQLAFATNNIKAALQQNPDVLNVFDEGMYGYLQSNTPESKANFERVFTARSRFMNGVASLQDIAIIDAHYNAVMTAKQKGEETSNVVEKVKQQQRNKPPKVQGAGQGVAKKENTFDINAWRESSADGKIAMLKRMREETLN